MTDEHFEKYDALAKKLGIEELKKLLPRRNEGADPRWRVVTAQAKGIASGLPREMTARAERACSEHPERPQRSPDEWRTLLAADEHLNNVDLSLWDLRHDAVIELTRLAAKHDGDTSFQTSLCLTVCVLKHVARYYATL